MPETGQRVVAIAGGAGGMGRAIARRLGSAGDRIALIDLPGEGLEATAATLAADGIMATTIPADIRTKAACIAAVAQAEAWGGRLDVLVNAAGVWLEGPSEDTDEAAYDRVMAVNLKGSFFLCAAAIPRLPDGGAIINIASDAGLVGNCGAAVYSASKGGVVLMTRALALELAPRGIRVTAICPADVETPMIAYQAETFGGGDPEGYRRRLLAHYPQGARARFIRPEEIAALVAFLCGPEAAPLTGAALPVDFAVTAGY